ncbi:hypothetical protein LQ384_23745 [Rhodococcus rhodochrous]|uniref:Uncharacterized protein n=1 Tax=Rhodococcus rhodochrous TaxID=1829 RepID=A0AAW4XMI3_RHORH|nr:hypothetical protein [Rhodococcus rhodochrous]MCD2114131.1 hypothetical protein [Rhodococcus rhodochrous]
MIAALAAGTVRIRAKMTAAVDRLHHAHVVITEGTSLRVQDATVGRGDALS